MAAQFAVLPFLGKSLLAGVGTALGLKASEAVQRVLGSRPGDVSPYYDASGYGAITQGQVMQLQSDPGYRANERDYDLAASNAEYSARLDMDYEHAQRMGELQNAIAIARARAMAHQIPVDSIFYSALRRILGDAQLNEIMRTQPDDMDLPISP